MDSGQYKSTEPHIESDPSLVMYSDINIQQIYNITK